MCASSRRTSWTGNAPTGTVTDTDRWWLSPMRKRCCPNRPTYFLVRKAASPEQSAVGQTRHKFASHGFRWHPPVACPCEGGGRPPNRSAKAHVQKLQWLRQQACLNVAQAFPVRKLGERHARYCSVQGSVRTARSPS